MAADGVKQITMDTKDFTPLYQGEIGCSLIRGAEKLAVAAEEEFSAEILQDRDDCARSQDPEMHYDSRYHILARLVACSTTALVGLQGKGRTVIVIRAKMNRFFDSPISASDEIYRTCMVI